MLFRFQLNPAIKEAKNWLIKQQKRGKNSKIYKTARFFIRNNNFKIYYKEAIQRLDNIEFYYDNIEKNLGETDGNVIRINTYHTWDHEMLVNLLIHEALHFMIKNDGKYYLPEKKEHNMMYQINPDLIG